MKNPPTFRLQGNDIELVDFYSIFRKEFELEKYLLRLPSHYRVWITKLRTSNLKLPIEVGRWYGIPKVNRHCILCLKNIGDEFHF